MNVVWLDTVDSTNSEALRRLGELPSGTVLAAREQTAGRGQRGNTWFTEPGKNLTFSIVLKFGEGALDPLPVSDSKWFNYLIATSVVDFLQSYAIWCKVKWPNDVYVGNNKICGILIENVLSGNQLAATVIGVGININQREFPQLAHATSLLRLVGGEHNLEQCLDQLLSGFERRLPDVFDPQDHGGLFHAYTSHLFNLDCNARYHDLLTDREYTGIIQGVAPDGRLMIKDLEAPGKPIRYYAFKEVSYIL